VPTQGIAGVPASGIIDFYHYSNLGGRTHLLADVVGYYDDDHSTDAGRFLARQPLRISDSRLSGTCLPAGVVGALSFNSALGGVVINTTVTQPTAPGHLIVFPMPGPPPLASNLNFVPGQTVPNLVMVKVGDGGKVGFYNSAGCTHLVIDLFGVFTGPGSSATSDATATRGGGPSVPDIGIGPLEIG
jgi:hypothetical protein